MNGAVGGNAVVARGRLTQYLTVRKRRSLKSSTSIPLMQVFLLGSRETSLRLVVSLAVTKMRAYRQKK